MRSWSFVRESYGDARPLLSRPRVRARRFLKRRPELEFSGATSLAATIAAAKSTPVDAGAHRKELRTRDIQLRARRGSRSEGLLPCLAFSCAVGCAAGARLLSRPRLQRSGDHRRVTRPRLGAPPRETDRRR